MKNLPCVAATNCFVKNCPCTIFQTKILNVKLPLKLFSIIAVTLSLEHASRGNSGLKDFTLMIKEGLILPVEGFSQGANCEYSLCVVVDKIYTYIHTYIHTLFIPEADYIYR